MTIIKVMIVTRDVYLLISSNRCSIEVCKLHNPWLS
jgi:hypothetical protein